MRQGYTNDQINRISEIYMGVGHVALASVAIPAVIDKMKLPRPYGRGIFSLCFVGSGIPPKQKEIRIHLRAYALSFLRRGINIILVILGLLVTIVFWGLSISILRKIW